MLDPAYKITIGSAVVDTTDKPGASTVVSLKVTLDLDTAADTVTLELAAVAGKLQPKRGDKMKIELGYRDGGGLNEVISGTIVGVEPSLTAIRVLGFSTASSLLRTLVNQTYLDKSAGAIVRDLASKASVPVDTCEDGIQFPAYVVDNRRSVYYHVNDLAQLSGFDVYITPAGKLVFARFANGKTIHSLDYAKHILDLQVRNWPIFAAEVTSWGESPGGGHGTNGWAWLTKSFKGGTAGSGSPTLLLEKSALRTKAAASTAATAEETLLRRRRVRGRLRTLGLPEVRLGDALQLSGLPQRDLNGSYQVRAVTHQLTKIAGFTTDIDFQATTQ
jgi:phage protein D